MFNSEAMESEEGSSTYSSMSWSTQSGNNLTTDEIYVKIAAELQKYELSYAEPVEKIPKIANVGPDFKNFKPINERSIYYRLIMDPACIQDEAAIWVQSWSDDRERTTINMLQLFIDVAGMQNFKVNQSYNKDRYEAILDEAFQFLPDTMGFRFLLLNNTGWAKRVQIILVKFIDAVVQIAEKKSALFKDIFREVFRFLATMCKSHLLPFKQTGTFFALRFCIAIGKIAKSHGFVLLRLNEYRSIHKELEQKISRCEKEHTLCVKYTEFLAFHILAECSDYEYHNIDVFYEQCMRYMGYMYIFVDHPELRDNILRAIVNIILHSEKTASAQAAIASLEMLFTHDRIQFTECDISEIIKVLHNTTLSADLKVGANAIRGLCAATDRYLEFFSQRVIQMVSFFMFNKYYILAKEGGRFFMTVQRRNSNSIKELLLKLIYLAVLNKDRNMTRLFVESIINDAPEIHFPKEFIKLLQSRDLNFEEEVALLEIMAFAIDIKLCGSSEKPREGFKTIIYSPGEVSEVISELFPKLPALFKKYSTEEKCLRSLLLIMKKLPYDNFNMGQFRQELNQLLKQFQTMFDTLNDEDLLLSLSEILYLCSSESSCIQTQALATVRCLTEKYNSQYNAYLSEYIWNENDEDIVNRIIIKLGIIRKYNPPEENEKFNSLRRVRQCSDEQSINDLKHEVNFFLQKVKMYVANSNPASKKSLMDLYRDLCEKMCEDLSTIESIKYISTAINLFIDVRTCLSLEVNLQLDKEWRFNTQQERIFSSSIRKRLEVKDDESLPLLRKLLEGSHIPSSISCYTWALIDQLYELYGDLYDNTIKRILRTSSKIGLFLISSTIAMEVFGLCKQCITASENVNGLMKLTRRLLKYLTKQQLYELSSGWVLLASKSAECMVLLDLIKTFCDQLTATNRRFLIAKLQKSFSHGVYKSVRVQSLRKRLQTNLDE